MGCNVIDGTLGFHNDRQHWESFLCVWSHNMVEPRYLKQRKRHKKSFVFRTDHPPNVMLQIFL